MFLNNKYTRWYNNIINNAQCQQRSKLKRNDLNYVCYENHHIIPECLGGTERVLLTAREHFICHLLLTKMLKGPPKYKMINAIIKMAYSKSKGQERYTSKSYSYIKKLMIEKNAFLFKGKIPWNKGKTYKKKIGCSEETKRKIGLGNKGKLLGDNNPAKRLDIRNKISKKKKGVKIPKSKFENNPRSKITNVQRLEIITQWENCLVNESLYSFTRRIGNNYSVSVSCIQHLIYPKSNLEEHKKLLLLLVPV